MPTYAHTKQQKKVQLCRLVSPTVMGENGLDTRQGGLEKSRQFAHAYAEIAQELGCKFFDTGGVIESSPIDGVHFSAGMQQTLGKAMAKVVTK